MEIVIDQALTFTALTCFAIVQVYISTRALVAMKRLW